MVKYGDEGGMAQPLSRQELATLKADFGPDAYAHYSEADGVWTCVCGAGGNTGDACVLCGCTREENQTPNAGKNRLEAFLAGLAQFATVRDMEAAFPALEPYVDSETYEQGKQFFEERRMTIRMYGKTLAAVRQEDIDKMNTLLGENQP